MEFDIQKAENGDICALRQLIESAYRGESAKYGWTSETDLIDGNRLNGGELEATMQNANSQILVIRDSVETGSILASICLYRDGEKCEFGMFAVNPLKQSNGIGKALLAYAENFAKTEWGFDKMQLSVITQRNTLIDFYKRRGYVATGKKFSMSDHHLNQEMTRGHDLELEVYEKQL